MVVEVVDVVVVSSLVVVEVVDVVVEVVDVVVDGSIVSSDPPQNEKNRITTAIFFIVSFY